MDPLTGLAALAGVALASLASLRLKKNMEEGFEALPDTNTDYQASVAESQSRYNMFSGLVNPITNSIIPVGSPESTIKDQKDLVKSTLGGYSAEFDPGSSQTLVLKKFENQFEPRSDSNKSLYGAMKFCREAGKQTNPFTTFNSDGSVKTQGAVSPDGQWKFDEVCGVCITSGKDEEGNRFRNVQGMVIDPNQKEAALTEQSNKSWPYPRIGPALGTCEGAPNAPAFAVTAKDLEAYKARQACLTNKTLGGTDNCALCYQSEDVYSSVGPNAETFPIHFVMQGVGNVDLRIKGASVGTKTLSESSPVTMELTGAKEGDSFSINVSSTGGQATTIYGYLKSQTPRDGLFVMPLNLLATIDDETGSSPSKSTFKNFSDVGLSVTSMRPGPGKTSMRLRGAIPFTFVQPSEFSAMDCLDGPFQTREASLTAFSTDQPCYAKGSGPGKYNDACLRQRVLDMGCTNAGDLYKNPQSLNTKDGAAQGIVQISATLEGIAAQDMVDPEATKLCSGRQIQTPCDPFILRQGSLKFGSAVQGTNTLLANQANQCLSFLYHNRGANETANPPRVGPTYSNLTIFRNDKKDVKNIFCLPEGQLNPDTNAAGKQTLIRIADTGYKGKLGVDAIKQYLTDQLNMATDTMRNANTDPDRKAAITNCFGPNLNSLPSSVTGNPTRITNPCGITAQYVRVLPSQSVSQDQAFIEISQLAVINKDGQNVAPGKSTAGTSPSYPAHGFGTHNASFAIDGQVYAKGQNFYISQSPGGSSQFLLNLGTPTDITKIIYITRGNPTTLGYRKNGIRLQLLDANQNVINTRLLNSAIREEISYLQAGADPTCKDSLPPPASVTFPTGYRAGLYIRFYDIFVPDPDIVPGNRGWGGQLKAPSAYARVEFNDWNIGRFDRSGVVAKGYYIAPGPETLYLATVSDDGIYVSFNGVQRISRWNIHAPAWDASAAIQIPAAGIYPFELRFYEWGGGAACNLYYRINDEADWKSDLSQRFAYKLSEI
jgi:hypothetical protein